LVYVPKKHKLEDSRKVSWILGFDQPKTGRIIALRFGSFKIAGLSDITNEYFFGAIRNCQFILQMILHTQDSVLDCWLGFIKAHISS